MLAVTVGMADTIMVASAGEEAVSAVSLADSIFVLLINLFSALGTGGAVICGQQLAAETLIPPAVPRISSSFLQLYFRL